MNIKNQIGIKSLLVILVFSIGTIYSKDMNNLFTPYGFKAPFLKSGEIIISTVGTYSSYEDKTSDSNQSENSFGYSYELSYIGVSGILAISDKFLIGPGLYIIPSYEENYFQKDADFLYDISWETDMYLQPYFRFVYRPKQTVEISGYVTRYKYNTNENYTFNDNQGDSGSSEGNRTRLELNLNYYGLKFKK